VERGYPGPTRGDCLINLVMTSPILSLRNSESSNTEHNIGHFNQLIPQLKVHSKSVVLAEIFHVAV